MLETIMHIFIILVILAILGMTIVIYIKIKNLQTGSCAGVPDFNSNSVYTKSMTIPIINYKVDGTATFKPDNSFILTFGTDSFPNNKWIYNKDSCSLSISLDSNLQSVIDKYNSSIDTNVGMNRLGQLIVNATISGLIPIQVILDPVK